MEEKILFILPNILILLYYALLTVNTVLELEAA